MPYQILIERRAQKQMAALSAAVIPRVDAAIRALTHDPRPAGCVKLTGRPGWRIRVGEYRVIYEIEDVVRIVTIVHVGHRSDVYR